LVIEVLFHNKELSTFPKQVHNQLLAIQSGQLADITSLLAAQGRAAALAGANDAETQAQAQAQLNQFLSTGTGYQPQAVEMFHQQ
jgi:P-type conjugative transfer protein TrbJ